MDNQPAPPAPPAAREYLTLDEVEREFPIRVGTARQKISEGRLASYKFGRRVLVKRADVVALIESGRR